jgi:hypothetical protein
MTTQAQDQNASAPKSTIALIGNVVRVWESTPNQAIVPCLDADGKIFELVFLDDMKTSFDTATLPVFDQMSQADEKGTDRMAVAVEGSWNKRMWRKTRTTNAWGHTWQFIVTSFSHATPNGATVSFTQNETADA